MSMAGLWLQRPTTSSTRSNGFDWWVQRAPPRGRRHREFLTSLIRHPRFAGTVNDIVVEFGNALYQDIADRYVAGEAVGRDQLKQIWENTTVATGSGPRR